MNKRLIFLFLAIISLLTTTYSAGSNQTYSKIEFEANGWCKDMDIVFKVYNQTQFLNKEQIKDNLCKINQTPEDDDCEEFQKIKGTVKITDGPIESLNKTVFTGSIDANSEFKVRFTTENAFLVQIIPEGKYQDYENLFDTITCRKTPISQEEINNKKYNHTFNFQTYNLNVNIKNTPIQNSSQITIVDMMSLQNLPENTIKALEIKPKDSKHSTNFTSLNLEFALSNIDKNEIKVYELNPSTMVWTQITFTKAQNKIILETNKFAIYAISQKLDEVVAPIITEQTNNNQENQEIIPEYEIAKEIKDNNQANLILGITIFGILVIIFITIIILKKKHKNQITNTTVSNNNNSNNNNQEQNNNNKEEHKEVLTTYNDTLEHVKQYIVQHKQSYSKDQLYRALIDANIPKDIIEKAFNQEFI